MLSVFVPQAKGGASSASPSTIFELLRSTLHRRTQEMHYSFMIPVLLLSPTKRQILFQKLSQHAHNRGVPCLKHSDGNIWSIFDIIIDAGADGVHPIDPMAGMDIGEAKTKFGNRVCLMGNVNCATTLCSGTVEEVCQETREVIRKAGRGGGLICMSSNSIHSGVKPENYVAMVKAIREYRQYPLSLG